MRDVNSTQRRRRLRLIQAEDKRTAQRFQKAASALAIAADTESARIDAEALQQHLRLECRARSRTRLRIEHPAVAPLTVVMTRPYLLIGSDPACDLRLDHEEIAPHHAFLQWVDGQIFCCDLAPRPSNLPIRRQPPNGRWLTAEPLEIGPYLLHLDSDVSLAEPDYSPLDRSPRLLSDFPQFALQFQGVEQSDNQWPVNRLLTMIGRGSQCKLRLNHPSMPNVQACLLRTKNACWLIDVAGTGSTGVNGRMIRVAAIDIGDVLQLGPFQVEVITTVFEPSDMPVPSSKPKPKSRPSSKVDLVSTPPAQPETSSEHPIRLVFGTSGDQRSAVGPVGNVPDTTISSAVEPPRAESRLDAMDSFVGPAVAEKPVESLFPVLPEHSEAKLSEAAAPSTGVSWESIAEFVQSQQRQLSLLKLGIEQIKLSYEQASNRQISKQIRYPLDRSVNETLLIHRALCESLDKWIASVSSAPNPDESTQ